MRPSQWDFSPQEGHARLNRSGGRARVELLRSKTSCSFRSQMRAVLSGRYIDSHILGLIESPEALRWHVVDRADCTHRQ
jgi:hypothetical protein